MKFLIIIFACLFSTVVSAQSQLDRKKLNEIVVELKTQQKAEFETVLKDLKGSREYAKSLWTDLDTAQKQINTVGQERDGWKLYGEDRNEKWLNAEKRVAEQKVSKLKWMGFFFGLAILVIAYFGLKFLTPIGKFIP